MADPISSSAISRVSVVASADEAISLTRATEIFQADTLISAAVLGLQTAKPVLDRFVHLSQVASIISKRSAGSFTPISVANLLATPKNSTALREFFNADGPVLGSNLDEANANFASLQGAGIEIVAPVQIPVLVEIVRGDEKTSTTAIAWLTPDHVSSLSAFPKSGSSPYPGSEERIWELKDSKGKVVQTTRYTIFEDYANRRPQLSSLADGLALLTEMVNDVSEQLSLELKFAQRASVEANRTLESAEAFKKDQDALIQNIDATNTELVDASLRIMQLLHRERQLLIIRQDANDKEAATLSRLGSEARITSISPLDHLASMLSGDERKFDIHSAGMEEIADKDRKPSTDIGLEVDFLKMESRSEDAEKDDRPEDSKIKSHPRDSMKNNPAGSADSGNQAQ